MAGLVAIQLFNRLAGLVATAIYYVLPETLNVYSPLKHAFSAQKHVFSAQKTRILSQKSSKLCSQVYIDAF